MVKIAPNRSIITANVLTLNTYLLQENSFITTLKVISSRPIATYMQMPGTEKGSELQALLSAQLATKLSIVVGSEIECEIQKVAIDLWRIDFVLTATK